MHRTAQVRSKLLELGVIDKLSALVTEKVRNDEAEALKEYGIGILANMLSEESVKEVYLEELGINHVTAVLNAAPAEGTRCAAMLMVTNLAYQSASIAEKFSSGEVYKLVRSYATAGNETQRVIKRANTALAVITGEPMAGGVALDTSTLPCLYKPKFTGYCLDLDV